MQRALHKHFEGGDPALCGLQYWSGGRLGAGKGKAKERHLCLAQSGLFVLSDSGVERHVPYGAISELVDDPDDPTCLALRVSREHDLLFYLPSGAERDKAVRVLSQEARDMTRRPLHWETGEQLEEALNLEKAKTWKNTVTKVPKAELSSPRAAAPPAAVPVQRPAPAAGPSLMPVQLDEVPTGGRELRRPDDSPLYFKPHHLEGAPPSAANWKPRYLSVYYGDDGEKMLRLRKPGPGGQGVVPTRGSWAMPLASGVAATWAVVLPEEALNFFINRQGGETEKRYGPIAFRVGGGEQGTGWTFAAPSPEDRAEWLDWLAEAGIPVHHGTAAGSLDLAGAAALPPPHHTLPGEDGEEEDLLPDESLFAFRLNHPGEPVGMVYFRGGAADGSAPLMLAVAAKALGRANVPTPCELRGFCGVRCRDVRDLAAALAEWRESGSLEGDVVIAPPKELTPAAQAWVEEQQRLVDSGTSPLSDTKPGDVERRIDAADGMPYTREEFDGFYGWQSATRWELAPRAVPLGERSAETHPAATAEVEQAAPSYPGPPPYPPRRGHQIDPREATLRDWRERDGMAQHAAAMGRLSPPRPCGRGAVQPAPGNGGIYDLSGHSAQLQVGRAHHALAPPPPPPFQPPPGGYPGLPQEDSVWQLPPPPGPHLQARRDPIGPASARQVHFAAPTNFATYF
eukprot:TRINITY_DN55160_c0_g1_i1.p1 TRINITY_DN55160_c0_g1~~TRINITY_DN55160_c0_g1_i1.p1  ORF type:complete len:683 (+),score=160.94 TRINITY_DN55160_c0_g1_i1:136-2184(+)